MKIPYFEDSWNNKPREDKKTIIRTNVYVILKHSDKEEFWALDWVKFWWRSMVVGWVDDCESIVEAAKRETIEESWYNDFWEIKLLDFELNSKFFAKHKDINRYSVEKYVYIKLNSMNNVWVKPEEVENHNFVWLKKEKVKDFLNLDNHKYAWKLFTIWKNEDEEYLKALNTFNWYVRW